MLRWTLARVPKASSELVGNDLTFKLQNYQNLTISVRALSSMWKESEALKPVHAGTKLLVFAPLNNQQAHTALRTIKFRQTMRSCNFEQSETSTTLENLK